jgi:ribonuclease HI
MSKLPGGLQLFADGCYEPCSRQGGWAFVAYRDGVEIASDFGGVNGSGNNAMEVMGLLRAAMWINGHAAGEPAVIWSDSVHAVTGCNSWRHIWKNNRWKKKSPNAKLRSRTIANAELWQAIDLELSRNPFMTVAWCKGHAGIEGNERSDELAERGRVSITKG